MAKTKKRRRSVGVPDRQRYEQTANPNFPTFKTRMTPGGIVEFINGMSDLQRTSIEEMGFDGLLGLKTDKIPGDLSYWLVTNFDPFSSSLMDGSLPITDEDIQRATGLPKGPLEVVEAGKPDSSQEYQDDVTVWASQFGSRQVEKKDLLAKIKEQREGGEDFKRNFIVFVVSTLLRGIKGTNVTCRILKSLRDVSLISKFNWCYYTRKNFIESVLDWREQLDTCVVPTYSGPVLIMVFIYLDRVCFKGERRFAGVYPTISCWTKEEIQNRIKKEKKEAKSFGLGAVVDPPALGYVHEGRSENQNNNDMSEDEKCEVPTCIQVLAEAAKEFAQAYGKFSKAVRRAKSEAPSELVCQMAAFADIMVEGFKNTQHNNEETEGDEEEKKDINSDIEEDDKEDMEKVKLDKGKSKMEEFKMEGFDIDEEDKWFNDPEVIRLLNEAMDQLDIAFRPESSKVRKHRPIKNPDQPTFSLFDSQDSLYVTPGYEDDPPKVHNNSDDAPKVPLHTTPVNDPPKVHNNSDNVPLHITTPVSSPSTRHSPRLSPTVIPEPVLERRNKDVSAIYKSPFLQRNINLLVGFKQEEKDVADFCFTNALDNREIVFSSRHHRLRRWDLKSLISDVDRVNAKLIYAWCHYLNTNERLRSVESPHRLFLSLSDEVICDDIDDTVSLVFFPIIDPWMILICVNFISSKIEVIHTMKEKSVVFCTVVTQVKAYMKKHFTEKIPKTQLLWCFKIEEFVPKAHVHGTDDNGIFLMRHMDLYKGNKKCLGMSQIETVLKKAKVKYCHALLTSDENSLKDKVLKDARCYRTGISDQMNEDVQAMTDENLWNFVFNDSDESEVLVDTDWMQGTRKGLCSLEPGKWLMDMVIDMMGLYCLHSKEDLLYLPTTLRNLNPTYHKTIGNQYFKTSYFPKAGCNIVKVFMPILMDDHWLLCIADMKMQVNYLLDSKAPRRGNTRQKQQIGKMVSSVAEILSRSEGYHHFKTMADFPLEHVKGYPLQSDGYNCGAYVLKTLEAGHDNSSWKQKALYKNLDEYRKDVVLKLLRWDQNKRKVFC